MRIESILEEVKRLAVEAGTFIAEQRQHFDASKVESKHSHDYVSYVDKQCEQMIVARLKEILPEALRPSLSEGACGHGFPSD